MKSFSLKLPQALHSKLGAAARRRKMTQSALAREALESYLKNGPGLEGISAYDLAPHFAGCLDSGVTDLATNKKYLDDFGR